MRLWSLQTGRLLTPPPPPELSARRSLLHPTLPTFSAPPALPVSSWSMGEAEPELGRRQFDAPVRAVGWRAEVQGGWGVSLWVADGGGVEEFMVG